MNSVPATDTDLLAAISSSRSRDRLAVFCGAGISMNRAKLPNFPGLLREVAETLNYSLSDEQIGKLKKNECFEVAYELDKHGVSEADWDRYGQATPFRTELTTNLTRQDCDLSLHGEILRVAALEGAKPRIITTNFDILLTDAYRKYFSRELTIAVPDQTPDKPRKWKGIWHLHGSIFDDRSIYVAKNDFKPLYLHGRSSETLTDFFEEFDVLFLGYALGDEYVKEILRSIQMPENRSHWIAHADNETLPEVSGVTYVPYHNDDGHEGLGTFVEALAANTHHDLHNLEELSGALASPATSQGTREHNSDPEDRERNRE